MRTLGIQLKTYMNQEFGNNLSQKMISTSSKSLIGIVAKGFLFEKPGRKPFPPGL